MIDYKFNEEENINELKKHIDSTYDSHYSKEQFQATEFIVDGGHGTGFCIGNIMKYAQRYGKKGDAAQARKDLMKILHYAIIQLHVHDLKEADLPIADIDSDINNDYLNYIIPHMDPELGCFRETVLPA